MQYRELGHTGLKVSEIGFGAEWMTTAHAYAGACIYCGHCQPCVVGIDIATVNKFADLALMHEEIPESVREHYVALARTPETASVAAPASPTAPSASTSPTG